MKIFVFGAGGMLGRYVYGYLKDAIPITRTEINAMSLRDEVFNKQLDILNIGGGDVIINCMGITNKHTREISEFLAVNSIFPRLLADYCERRRAHLLHISTDCVFDGRDGNYDENSPHTEQGIYGLSKSLGEPYNATVIRTSIIGENPVHNLDLLEWVKKQHGGVINGWINYFWNGITCLQFAKICEEIIKNVMYWNGVRHIFSEQTSKADLIGLINDIYKCNCTPIRREAEIPCNRTLTSIYERMFKIPSIKEQIVEQKNFKL